MRHELWVAGDGSQMFCLAGHMGDDARRLLSAVAELAWTVDAGSHFEAMTVYYEQMGWGMYTTDFPEIDRQSYADRRWE